jgi:Zn-finger nucleic acid-binding protein
MVKNNAGPTCECKIDECYVCGTRFLNYGELLKIREKAGENSPEYESALKIIIAENNRLKDQHERSDSMYKKIQNAGDTFFKKH